MDVISIVPPNRILFSAIGVNATLASLKIIGCFILNYKSSNDDGKFSISSNGKMLADQVDVTKTGARDAWQTVIVKNIHLAAGRKRIRIKAIKGGFNLEQIMIN